MGESVYFNAPIEFFRNFIEKPHECLDLAIDYATVTYYDTLKEAQAGLKFHGGEDDYEDREDNVKGASRGVEFSGVMYSIPSTLFWDYYENTKTELDLLVFLAYHSLKSMCGGLFYHTWICNSETMFMRMAGYAKKAEFEKALNAGKLGVIGGYMGKRTMSYWSEKLRLELMRRFDMLHIYSQKGRRGFAVMFSNNIGDREFCLKQLAEDWGCRREKYAEVRRQLNEARKSVTKRNKV